jgi:hypothetical protein
MKNYYWHRNELRIKANNKQELINFIDSLSSVGKYGFVNQIDFNSIISLPSDIPYEPEYSKNSEYILWRKEHWGTIYNPADIKIDIKKSNINPSCNIEFYTFESSVSKELVNTLQTKNPNLEIIFYGDR